MRQQISAKQSNPENGGSYRVTAPATHAATVLVRNFQFRTLPGQKIDATADNLARVIDYSTRLPQMLPVLKWFVQENPWYDHKPVRSNVGDAYIDEFLDWTGEGRGLYDRATRLEDNLERLRYGIRQLELAHEKLPRVEGKGIPCGAAWQAAKNLFKIFEFEPQPRMRAIVKRCGDKRTVAILIDTSASCFRVQACVERLMESSCWEDPLEMKSRIEQVRNGVRVVELVNNYIPAFPKQSTSYTVRPAGQETARPDITQRELGDLSGKLAAATSPTEEQGILKDWRVHTNGNRNS